MAEAREVLDQVQQHRVTPMQVIEHDHQRRGTTRVLEQPAHSPRDLRRRGHRRLLPQQHIDRGSHLGVAAHQVGGAAASVLGVEQLLNH